MSKACIEFARWALTEGSFQGCNLDGGEIQDKALELGLIRETKFDPAKHGEHSDFEKGDSYYEFAGPLARARSAQP